MNITKSYTIYFTVVINQEVAVVIGEKVCRNPNGAVIRSYAQKQTQAPTFLLLQQRKTCKITLATVIYNLLIEVWHGKKKKMKLNFDAGIYRSTR